MPGLWSRIKTWSNGEIVTNEDINAEFNNVITNAVPDQIDDWSANASQMQEVTDPGGVGAESLAASLKEELRRLRFAIKRIIGGAQWYSAPSVDLEYLNILNTSYFPNNVISFEGETTEEALGNAINNGFFPTSETVNSVVADPKFGTYALNANAVSAFFSNMDRNHLGSISLWFKSFIANGYILYCPQLGIEVYLDGSGFLNFKQTLKTSPSAGVKDTRIITGSNNRVSGTYQHLLLTWANNGSNGASADLIGMKLGGVDEGSQLSGQSKKISVPRKVTWFLGAVPSAQTFGLSLTFNDSPVTTDGFTLSGTAGSFLDGIMTLDTSGGAATRAYSKVAAGNFSYVNLSSGHIRVKMRVTRSACATNTSALSTYLYVRDDSIDRDFQLGFNVNGVQVNDQQAGVRNFITSVDMTDWNVFDILFSSGRAFLYVNGELFGNTELTGVNATANDMVDFGCDTGGAQLSEWEYIYMSGSSVGAPVGSGTGGSLDEIGLFPSIISNSTFVTKLQSNKIKDITFYKSPGIRPQRGWSLPSQFDTTSATYALMDTSTMATVQTFKVLSDGKTPILINYTVNAQSDAATDAYFVITVDTAYGTPASLTALGSPCVKYTAWGYLQFDSAGHSMLSSGCKQFCLPAGLWALSFYGAKAGAGTFQVMPQQTNVHFINQK